MEGRGVRPLVSSGGLMKSGRRGSGRETCENSEVGGGSRVVAKLQPREKWRREMSRWRLRHFSTHFFNLQSEFSPSERTFPTSNPTF